MFNIVQRSCWIFWILFFSLTIQQLIGESFDREIESAYMDIFSGEFGYTLIGVKPISLDYVPSTYMRSSPELCEKLAVVLRKTFAETSNFVLKILPTYGQGYSLELINKKALREIVCKHAALKLFIKKEFKTEEKFLLEIENTHLGLHSILKGNEEVIGYLLGYSKTNINYYLRRKEIGKFLKKYPLFIVAPFPGIPYYYGTGLRRNVEPYICQKPKIDAGFGSLEAEWHWIQEVAWDISENSFPSPPYFVSLPVYVCRHGRDSEMDRRKFKKARNRIAALFYGKSFQEAVANFAKGAR